MIPTTPEEESVIRKFMYNNLPMMNAITHTREAMLTLLQLLAWQHIDRVLDQGDWLLYRAKKANCDRTSSKVLPDQKGKTLSP